MLEIKKKSVTLATILALCVWGLGHIYAGRIRRGLILLTGMMFFFLIEILFYILVLSGPIETTGLYNMLPMLPPLVAGLAGFYVWIRQVVDARKVAKEYNKMIRKSLV